MVFTPNMVSAYGSGKQLVFEDGASGEATLANGSWTTTSGSTTWFPSVHANLLIVDVETTLDGAETNLQMKLKWRQNATFSTESEGLATNSVIGGEEDVDSHVVDLDHSNALQHGYSFACSPYKEYSIEFYQDGGTTTSAKAYFTFTRA